MTVGHHLYSCHHRCPEGVEFTSSGRKKTEEKQITDAQSSRLWIQTAVSAHIQYIGKAEMYLLHPPGEIILNTAASVTDEQGELPVQQSIHQDHLDVSKLGDMHGLLVSDTFSMSIFYIDSTISCAVWWLLTSSFPPWLHCNKSAICFGSESSLCGSFATSSQFAGFLCVWLSGFSVPVMHHPFCSHQEATSTVQHHSICPPNTLHSLFMTGPAPVCLVWLFFARFELWAH